MTLIAELAIILAAVAAASMIGARLRLPAIPLFILAGIILGPHAPFPAVIPLDEPLFLIGEIGIILLLFYLGLEFSLDRILQARSLVLTGGVVDLLINGGLGLAMGLFLLGPGPEAILLAGIVYVSSTGIITQALFDFRRLADDETDLILGVLVFEDLAVALFLGVASGLAVGTAVDAGGVAIHTAVVVAFVVLFLLASRYLPRYIDRVSPFVERERLVFASLALVVGSAALAEWAGLSAPIGALLAGILLSGTEVRDRIERHLYGLRDFAAAVFFLIVGLQIDMGSLGSVWAWLVIAVVVAVVGKIAGGWIAGRATGFSKRQSLVVGTSLIARGEFTLVLAQLAVLGTALAPEFRERILSFAGLFVLVTAVVGVILMRESRTVGRAIFARRARS
ncbi:MAG: cation:proton antiporter [Thermoleophilia bacterium]|nr:cation:proton antiporter [Thermoleophilia bacterium]